MGYCVNEEKSCNEWVEKYFKDCLCNLKDDFSFGFGLLSLVCWGVAEIPQIITNFRTKSSHGVSLAFLLTWIAGDIFNLVGCLLEPATLPTQYYTAVLYTTSTVVLVLQGLYYDYIYRWLKCRQKHHKVDEEEDEKQPLREAKAVDESGIPIPTRAVPVRREFYYVSARSLAESGTPPFRNYLRAAKSGPSAVRLIHNDSSSSDDESSAAAVSSSSSSTQPRPIPRSAGYGTFLATSLNLPSHGNALAQACIGLTSRKLLQEGGMDSSAVGQWLGWLMAAIYMGGRIPQIWLNIKRGSVEGLNPLMFVFALIANLTYVLSIIVRTTEWDKIKANLPWLLDAAVCVLLDLFIIVQYIYYRYLRDRGNGHERGRDDSDGDYYINNGDVGSKQTH
ncbi:Probable vacuolar amino acid transporter YPQ1 [Linum grandiflorum]